MAKTPNTKTIYIRDENLKKWEGIEKKHKGGFINWCLQKKNLFESYLKDINK